MQVISRFAFVVFSLTIVVGSLNAAGKYKILHNFAGGTDGAEPAASLIFDDASNLYGTTAAGGNGTACFQGCGTVFKLTPLGNGHWKEAVLHAFNGQDGQDPESNLILDSSGNLYGTTFTGPGGGGVVFELSPNPAGQWHEIVLHTFQGSDGYQPAGTLIFDRHGNLYGTTLQGGPENGGTVFELSPPDGIHGAWTERVIYSPPGHLNYPEGNLAMDRNGNIYGSTAFGGNTEKCVFGCGMVFEVKKVHGTWEGTILYKFRGSAYGSHPRGGVTFDHEGSLFGVLTTGGNGQGAIFELQPTSGGRWREAMIYRFCTENDCFDGAEPRAGLIFDSAGNLYGTTRFGGSGTCSGRQYFCGTVFELTPSGHAWKETVLYNFGQIDNDGAEPYVGLIRDKQGKFYGTTLGGGTAGLGVVFQLKP